MFKNITIREISRYTSVCVWLLHMLSLFLFYLLGGLPVLPYWGYIIYSAVSFLATYYIVIYLFEKFVFRKIKLIYKVISDSKNSLSNVSDFQDKTTVLDSVNQTVLDWATAKDEELTQLKSLEEYRKKFVGDISHELKTPLFSIQGYLYTLIEGGLYDEQINMKYLKSALRGADRLQGIVDDLEIITELESDTTKVDYATFDLKELSSDVFSDLELMAKECGIQLVYKSGADATYKVYADKEKIRQVFVNLVNNSLKYGRQNKDGITKISFYDMEAVILVEISDNGVGIKDEDMKHVFDRFYRTDLSRSQKVKGTGLGLSIVKHIIEAHNQTITVRSTYGKGSTFGFTVQKSK
ncbi:ATP-binding protein [Saprospiraceae bacterium]|nr:ATP-binding protein [Saprospiraceae bacterium]